VRPRVLTPARRRNLRARLAEATAEGWDLGAVERAARWVYRSTAPSAEGARKTGEPLDTLVRPAHWLGYLSASAQGVGLPVLAPVVPQATETRGLLAPLLARWLSEGVAELPPPSSWPDDVDFGAACRAICEASMASKARLGWEKVTATGETHRARWLGLVEQAYRPAAKAAK